MPSRRRRPGAHAPTPTVDGTSRTEPARTRESGMVTAELAVALPAVVLLLAIVLGSTRYAIDHIRCLDAAAAGARAAARGDSTPAIRELTTRGAPPGAHTDIATEGDRVRVRITVPRSGPWPLSELPAPHAEATALREHTTDVTP